jgi:uncharacterized protein YoxC
MGTMCLAVWLQDSDPSGTRHLILIAIGLMAVAIAVISVIMLVIGVKALKTIKEVGETAQEVKIKVMPLLDEVMEISKTSRILLQDVAPKLKVISDNLVTTSETLVEASNVARGAVDRIGETVTDANFRTQRQVARVDGMVTAALTTTAEVADTIVNGIKGPAQKLAVMLSQAKFAADGLMEKLKSMAANTPFGRGPRPE